MLYYCCFLSFGKLFFLYDLIFCDDFFLLSIFLNEFNFEFDLLILVDDCVFLFNDDDFFFSGGVEGGVFFILVVFIGGWGIINFGLVLVW